MVVIAATAGLVGSLFDSLLGASVQCIYWCDHCEKETERPLHSCGMRTRPLSRLGLDEQRHGQLPLLADGRTVGWQPGFADSHVGSYNAEHAYL